MAISALQKTLIAIILNMVSKSKKQETFSKVNGMNFGMLLVEVKTKSNKSRRIRTMQIQIQMKIFIKLKPKQNMKIIREGHLKALISNINHVNKAIVALNIRAHNTTNITNLLQITVIVIQIQINNQVTSPGLRNRKKNRESFMRIIKKNMKRDKDHQVIKTLSIMINIATSIILKKSDSMRSLHQKLIRNTNLKQIVFFINSIEDIIRKVCTKEPSDLYCQVLIHLKLKTLKMKKSLKPQMISFLRKQRSISMVKLKSQ